MAANEIHDCKEAQYQSPAQFLRHPLKHTTAVHSRRLHIILSVCRVITQKGKKTRVTKFGAHGDLQVPLARRWFWVQKVKDQGHLTFYVKNPTFYVTLSTDCIITI